MTTSVGSENFSREWLQPPPDPMPSPEASLYALLGRLVASEIDPDLMAVLRTPGVLETFENIAPGCLDGFDQEAAVVEFCRLFVLPGGVPAVAAAWLPGSDPNRSVAITGLVNALVSKLELSVPPDLPLDHAGILLSIMPWLLEKQPEASDDFQQTARDPWIGRFARALEHGAELPIYRAMAIILGAVAGPARNANKHASV